MAERPGTRPFRIQAPRGPRHTWHPWLQRCLQDLAKGWETHSRRGREPAAQGSGPARRRPCGPPARASQSRCTCSIRFQLSALAALSLSITQPTVPPLTRKLVANGTKILSKALPPSTPGCPGPSTLLPPSDFHHWPLGSSLASALSVPRIMSQLYHLQPAGLG